VQFAHRQLVVHRDIKPSNILVTRDGEVKLLDFGIATLTEECGQGEETETRQAYTPAYAAPEQLRGEVVTTAADIYALGAVLHELLSGRPAYGLAKNSSLHDRLRKLDEMPTALPSIATALPVSTEMPLSVDPLPARLLRGDLDVVTSTALRSDPSRRYGTVDALADDVQRIIDGRPIAARMEDLSYRVRKFVARHRASVLVAMSLLLALLAALALALMQAHRARDEAKRAQRQSDRAEAVRSFISGVFEEASPDANKGKPITPHELLEKGELQLNAGIASQPDLQADVEALVAALYQEIGDYSRADVLLKSAFEHSKNPLVPDDVKARVLVSMAAGETANDAYDDALRHARSAISLLKESPRGAAQTIADAHEIIGSGLKGKGLYAEAIAEFRSALSTDGTALGLQSEVIGEDWMQLGNALAEEGDIAQADIAFGKAIEIWRAIYGEDSYHVADALNALSGMLHSKGDLAGAEKALRQALEINIRTNGPAHHDTLAVESNLISLVEAQGRFDQAVPQRLQLAERAEQAGQWQPIDKVATDFNLGVDYTELGQFDEALIKLDQAIALFDGIAGPSSPRHVAVLRNKGITLMLAGRYNDSEASLRASLDILLKTDPGATLKIALGRLALGDLLRRQHRNAEALELLQQAARILVDLKQGGAPGRATALAALSEAQLDMGDSDSAYASAEASLEYARKDLPAGNYRLGDSLQAFARANLARGQAARAQALATEALRVRCPPYPSDDLRAVEVDVVLDGALNAQHRDREAAALRKDIEARLARAKSPYAKDLLARLGENR
jgi:tetratricopeptide (TPR) repeat protein